MDSQKVDRKRYTKSPGSESFLRCFSRLSTLSGSLGHRGTSQTDLGRQGSPHVGSCSPVTGDRPDLCQETTRPESPTDNP